MMETFGANLELIEVELTYIEFDHVNLIAVRVLAKIGLMWRDGLVASQRGCDGSGAQTQSGGVLQCLVIVLVVFAVAHLAHTAKFAYCS